MQSLTERKLACVWCIEYAVEYYCQRDFKLVDYNYSLAMINDRDMMYRIDNRNKDYNCFSEEQIMFKDDTMYMIVY